MSETPSRRVRFVLGLGGLVATAAGLDTAIRGARSIIGEPLASARLESELRFYAGIYVAYGAALLRAARRADTDAAEVASLATALFAGGAARAVGWARAGRPHPGQIALLAIELAGPPALVIAQRRTQR